MKMRKKKRLRQITSSEYNKSLFKISAKDQEKILAAVKKMMTQEWLEATAQRLAGRLQSFSERESNCVS
jgi:predicted Zn-dependent protease